MEERSTAGCHVEIDLSMSAEKTFSAPTPAPAGPTMDTSRRAHPFGPEAVRTVLFLAALALHAWYATRNFDTPFMPGHEFRQAQTAINSYYIDRDDNFGVLYETPIVGKPWVSVLMEVPLYEWSVVAVSREFGVAHILAARGISLACFYLTLPALYLLLGQAGLPRTGRWLALAMVLSCPVYIFYSRAFLMDSMELMCCAWFLHSYARLLQVRRWTWFIAATLFGTVAALVKSATLAVWLLPAAGWAAAALAVDWRARAGLRASLQTSFWVLAGVLVPLTALKLWVMLTDPLKAAHASAWIFTAANLSTGNWGLTEVSARISGKVWSLLAECWGQAILPPWLLLTLLAAGLATLPRVRRPVVGFAAIFFGAQLLFPFAYAYQDYYFYSCAVFLAGAFGWLAHGLLQSAAPRALSWLLVVTPIIGGFATYHRGYREGQLIRSEGGFAFTRAIRDFLPRDCVIVGAGADWSAIIPLYSQRRALMIRTGLENNANYLDRAFAELADEDVGALVLFGGQRGNRELVARAAQAFRLDEVPTFSDAHGDVYLSLRYRDSVRRELQNAGGYGMIVRPGGPIPPQNQAFAVPSAVARTSFPGVSPAPIRAHFKMGLGYIWIGRKEMVFAHPQADVWLRPPASATRLEWDFGIIPEAYEGREGRTDGVDFLVLARAPGEAERVVYRRFLDPAHDPADRGLQQLVLAYRPRPGEFLRFSTRAGRSEAFDWAYWARVEVK